MNYQALEITTITDVIDFKEDIVISKLEGYSKIGGRYHEGGNSTLKLCHRLEKVSGTSKASSTLLNRLSDFIQASSRSSKEAKNDLVWL